MLGWSVHSRVHGAQPQFQVGAIGSGATPRMRGGDIATGVVEAATEPLVARGGVGRVARGSNCVCSSVWVNV